jgi:hypothetical protein
VSWGSLPFLDLDGQHWPLSFAADLLDVPEEDLRDLVRILGIEPSGTMRMSDFRRQGRQPRCYPADRLILVTERIRSLREELFSGTADRIAIPCDDGGEARA